MTHLQDPFTPPARDPWAPDTRPLVFTYREMLAALVNRWRALLSASLVAGVLAGVAAWAFQGHRAESRFVPQASGADLAALSGLAAQFGFSFGGDGGESPDFYVALAQSSEILRSLAESEFEVPADYETTDSLKGALMDILDVEGRDHDERLRESVDLLRERVRGGTSLKTGLVSISTVAPSPFLAEAMNRRLLELVEDFDRRRRQANARAEREFVQARLGEVEEDLRAAEDAVALFLEQNRRVEQAARLRTQLDRLERDVSLRQGLFSSLAQAFEQARLEEVRNTPVLTVVDRPEGSARPTRSPVLFALLGAFLGGGAVAGMVVLRLYAAGRPELVRTDEDISNGGGAAAVRRGSAAPSY